MSGRSSSLPAAHGQNLPWLVAIVMLFLGLAGTLQATLLVFPREEQRPIEAATLPLPATVGQKPATEPIGTVTTKEAEKEIAECAPVFSVLFGYGQAAGDTPTAQYRQLAKWLNEHPAVNLVIRGYSDSAGDEYSNMALSHRRAEYVKSALLKAGLQNENISVQAFGEYSPLVGDEQSEANQRRATLTVPGFSDCRAKEESCQ